MLQCELSYQTSAEDVNRINPFKYPDAKRSIIGGIKYLMPVMTLQPRIGDLAMRPRVWV